MVAVVIISLMCMLNEKCNNNINNIIRTKVTNIRHETRWTFLTHNLYVEIVLDCCISWGWSLEGNDKLNESRIILFRFNDKLVNNYNFGMTPVWIFVFTYLDIWNIYEPEDCLDIFKWIGQISLVLI